MSYLIPSIPTPSQAMFLLFLTVSSTEVSEGPGLLNALSSSQYHLSFNGTMLVTVMTD